MPPSATDSFKTKASEREVRKLEAEFAEALPTGAPGTKLAAIKSSLQSLLTTVLAQLPICQERAQTVESIRKVWHDAKHAAVRVL